MSRQVSHGSTGNYQADEQAGVAGSAVDYQQMSRQVSRGSAGDYQADEQAGVARLNWRQSSRRAGRCRTAQFSIIKQMNRQVSLGSAVDYQADEQAGVARLSW